MQCMELTIDETMWENKVNLKNKNKRKHCPVEHRETNGKKKL